MISRKSIYTVSFFGHRRIGSESVALEGRLEAEILCLLDSKPYVEFLVGRNGDFDCGAGSDCEYWGEENIAILNLNCFKMLRLEINRYNDQKQLIEEPYGYMVKGGLYENDTG